MGGSRVQGACPRPDSLQFVLRYKRLERGRFRLPRVTATARTVEMDATELGMLLDGIDVSRVRRPPKWEPRRAEGAPTPSSG
jgi:transposase